MSMTSMSAITTTGAGAPVSKPRPKRVEVRWLESESELYLKQWQHRYHQLVGLDMNYQQMCRKSSAASDDFDDWLTGSGKTLLDLDLDFQAINTKNSNFIISNSNTSADSTTTGGHQRQTITAFDHIFWSTDDPLVKSAKNSATNKSNKRFKKSVFGLTAGPPDGQDFMGRRRRNTGANDEGMDCEEMASDGEENDSFENMRFTPIKRFANKTNNKKNNRNKNDIIFGEKERQFSIDLNKRLELLAKDQALSNTDTVTAVIDEAVLKARQPKSRQRDRTRPPRPRPPPIRRQIFKCEHSGCSYQSDRNFNFLRHKRTHRKTTPGADEAAAATANGVKVLTNLCVAAAIKSAPTPLAKVMGVQTIDIVNGNANPKLFITQTSNTSDTTSSTSSSIASALSVTTSSTGSAVDSMGSTTSADDLNALLLKTVTPMTPVAATAPTLDRLLKSCDTSEDTFKVITNNTNSCEDINNHSYHPHSCLD
ncbi:unnamed protein product [Oppiella nova]|uniref:C2H2-type domain-containing protein n=1 Tax=Oppiella nova TaxID=334625 RepID=A0A7R9QE48_9ACAR|nr:unnamed protein product [Oppiella nova]CAG2163988.1 unnamed protein product [Oppiella nova]